MKNCTYLLLVSLFLMPTAGQANNKPALVDLADWYVDAVNGDDINGTGSMDNPFKSISVLQSINEKHSGFVGKNDTVHLAPGNYNERIIIVDIPGFAIVGTLDDSGNPASILGEVRVTADKVTLKQCIFLDAGLTLKNANEVSVSNNLFSGTTRDSLVLLGASNNKVSGNRFESATESCVVIRNDPESRESSDNNIFERNYFTHHSKKKTAQAVLVNKSSFLGGLFGKKSMSGGNRFIECVFDETVSGRLGSVVADRSEANIVVEKGYSLKFEDCYFKKADRNTPFISFMIIGEPPEMEWYWDELKGDTWFSSNKNGELTGSLKSEFVPLIQFADGDGDGLILKTKIPVDSEAADAEPVVGENIPTQSNSAPMVVSPIDDVTVDENAKSDITNNFDVFEDDATADEDLKFFVNTDDTSFVSSQIEDDLLQLNYADGASGMALVTIEAIDDNKAEPQSSEDLFQVIEAEGKQDPEPEKGVWYVDKINGNYEKATGSKSNPFRAISQVFEAYAKQSDLEGVECIVYLSAGNYGDDILEINIPGLTVSGTLDESGRPLTVLGETQITADGVKLMNCEIRDSTLTLLNVKDVLVRNNVFSGTTSISLQLLGASKNRIENNEFSSALHDCVYFFWDPKTRKSSNENVFFRNYFTHRSGGITNRVIRANWSAGHNDSISYRNRFVECAFKETSVGQLLRVIDDDTNWWVAADYKYSVMFEDCYFKRADRPNPFSEFVILQGHPNFKWRWDDQINDTWVSSNDSWAITGDHNGWNHRPRIQFVDKNGNGRALELVYNAGLLPAVNTKTKALNSNAAGSD